MRLRDYVVCNSGGVWQVSAVEGDTCTLTSVEDGRVRETPAGDIRRTVISRDAMQDVISRIPYVRTIQAPSDKVRLEFYREAMAAFDEIEWVRVVKSVYLRGQDKRLSSAEVACGERAKGYLHGEIAALLGIPYADVEEHIAASVAADTW